MERAIYKLTSADAPALREALALWKQLFGVDLERTQLIIWAERYPQDLILRAFNVARSWATERHPSVVNPGDACRYTSGVLKNMMRLQEKADALLGREM
jgi:hypothetical protein